MFVPHRQANKNDAQHDVLDVPIREIVPSFEQLLMKIKCKLKSWKWKCKNTIGQYPRRIIKILYDKH